MIDQAAYSHAAALFAQLLSYPSAGQAKAARRLASCLEDWLPEARGAMEPCLRHILEESLEQREELFTSTFELSPLCALELGWHLFGEEYARGLLLVRLRQELARHGVAESRELPDHITHVLALLPRMEASRAAAFVRACALPALARMQRLLERQGSLHAGLLCALRLLLEARYGLVTPAECFDEAAGAASEGWIQGAPRREAAAACGSGAELVPLARNFTAGAAQQPAETGGKAGFAPAQGAPLALQEEWP